MFVADCIFSKRNNAAYSTRSFYNVTLAFFPLRLDRLCVTLRLGHKKQNSFCLFLFGMLIPGTQPSCCEEEQGAPRKGHV